MSEEHVPRASGAHNQLLEEASLWFSRMRGPDAEQYRPEFDKWIGGGALHRGAYADVKDAWRATHGMRRQVPPLDNPSLPPTAASRTKPIGVLVAALLLPLGVASGIGVFRLLSLPGSTESARIMPQAGELTASTASATFRLVDGTKLTLAPGSRLTFNYRANARKLTLLRGTARFDVAHEGRSFTVFAGGGAIIDHGTIFDVGIVQGRVQVRLIKGAVEVRMPRTAGATAPAATALKPGQLLAYAIKAPAAEQPTNSAVKPDEDKRVFDNASLARIIEAANAKPGIPILLHGTSVGKLLVSGTLRIDDHRHLARILADKLNLNVTEDGGAIILSPP